MGPISDKGRLSQFRAKIKHIVIIYQENWSFDGLYGKFPGANNLSRAVSCQQVDKNGAVIRILPPPVDNNVDPPIIDTHFPKNMPAQPYDLLTYISPDVRTGDLRHKFYTEQLQIDGGKMDKFVIWSDNGGLVQSYFDATNLPEGRLAQDYTLCDNFFHSAFGGSFLNHIWLIAASTPRWKTPPQKFISQPDPDKPNFKDNVVTPDGYVVNNAYSVNHPHPRYSRYLLPNQTFPTIGDRMNDDHISWGWYSGGWNDALAGRPDSLFEYHHQPFVYFKNFRDGTRNKTDHLRDETELYTDLQRGNFPAVCFIKPLGEDNEHPGYASLLRGQLHVDSLVQLIMNQPFWNETAIIILYDENGGRWDHVPPPLIDRWGPGSRVPAIIISPYARKGYIDHTQYETVSILKFIEERYALKPLGSRDSNAADLLNAFEF